jgi:predicted O-linked N-acetylglucosamine transferase (SPINDLY family)
MGSLQRKSDAILEQHASSAATWLDALIATSNHDNIAPCDIEPGRTRLQAIPFDAFLSALERARPTIDRPTEIAFYERWIEANTGTSPLVYAAWFNLGVLHAAAGNQAGAASAYGNTLTLRPDMHGAAINLGLLLERSGQPEQALATWKRATQPDDVRLALEIQQGRLLEKLGRFDEAETILRRTLLTDPAQPDVIHHWVHIRQKSCKWPVALPNIPDLAPADLLRRSGPLGILALTDDIELQREAAAAWVQRKTTPAPGRLAPPAPYPHQRIRIGYMSSDFCSHAMSYLITELFERHDRTRFEVYGYDASNEDGTDLRKRVLAAFDHHRPIHALSDDQAAQLIRNDEIDILIDLNGITDGSRVAILRWKPAPIQATYLGFIGPLPMPELDYLLCDNVVIPPEHQAAYQPQPLPIARIYQANDSKRTIGRPLSRAELGLPDGSFVMCCFSRHYKVTEEMFAAWMSILHRAPNAVLWLAKDNDCSQENLRAAAAAAGIPDHRIIFSERADPDLYLSRLGVANLFLDTYPYNAGTVASDAIRMRLPLVTLCGDAFASRMAASLLHAAGAPQGITTSLPKYIDRIVQFANDPAEYAIYKALFTDDAWSRTIGNIASFTAEYEATWCRIVLEARHKFA